MTAPHVHSEPAARPRSRALRRVPVLLGALLALAIASAAGAQDATHLTIDSGKLIVTQNGHPLRVEEFALQRLSDTLLVRSASQGYSGPGQPEHKVDKTSVLVVGALDYALGEYWSTLAAGPDTLKRGITVAPGDTAYTSWREFDKRGEGRVMVLPPGRLYILDPPLFTMFCVLGQSLKGKSCDQRPVTVMVLGSPSDTVVTAIVNEVGTETFRWGGRPVAARKLTIADQRTTFTAWIAEDGRLLRLEQPEAQLVIERQAPPLKRRASSSR